MITLKDRALGGFLGLAIGDALGAQVEFKSPGTFPKVIEMTGGGVFNLQPGQITDDTMMSILTARSLIDCNGFDPKDMMGKFSKWSTSPACFDIGNTIQDAIYAYKRTGEAFQGVDDLSQSGNGSLMRIYPSILWTLHMNLETTFNHVWDMSRLTHGSQLVKEVSYDFFKLMRQIILCDCSKEELLASVKIEGPIKSTGFVVDTYNTALWGFSESQNFEEGLLKVVNLGGDADTAGAVYGQLAGSFYGLKALPDRFLMLIKEKEEIKTLVLKLINSQKYP